MELEIRIGTGGTRNRDDHRNWKRDGNPIGIKKRDASRNLNKEWNMYFHPSCVASLSLGMRSESEKRAKTRGRSKQVVQSPQLLLTGT